MRVCSPLEGWPQIEGLFAVFSGFLSGLFPPVHAFSRRVGVSLFPLDPGAFFFLLRNLCASSFDALPSNRGPRLAPQPGPFFGFMGDFAFTLETGGGGVVRPPHGREATPVVPLGPPFQRG